jgi:hypothetical protein
MLLAITRIHANNKVIVSATATDDKMIGVEIERCLVAIIE